MIIVGMTGCGKTYYLLKMLESDYKGHFEYIFLICPTYLHNKTYQEWEYKDDKKFFPIPCDQDHVEGFLKYIQISTVKQTALSYSMIVQVVNL